MKYFEEEQGLPPWFLWLMLPTVLVSVGVIGSLLYANGEKISQGLGDVEKQKDFWWSLGITIGVNLLMVFLFFWTKLQTKVESGILMIRYFPFTKWKSFPGKNIVSFEPVRYSPIGDAGGYGIRKSKKFGKVYNASGDQGVFIHFRSGEKLLLGTQKPAVLQDALKRIV